jgi:hypothetical protein
MCQALRIDGVDAAHRLTLLRNYDASPHAAKEAGGVDPRRFRR